ncbi:uncharacterized protein LOC109139587 isoform X2 [Larimichthys crocea]|uniref:uncharacterized protein LOC109139587 isoform X2 n=1 Tax=Larimichthys crocea TaxID=215358 RepID=UPI000F5E0E50|nr:uncharacterized protein LOC109139587 isoform X2 [Larimichthys crocea]
MDVSRTNLNKLESENLPDVTDVSLRAQDITRDSQLDFSHQDGGSNETCISSVTTTMMSVEEYGAARIDVTQLTVSSLDESQRNLSMMDPQPEDEDEELEMILRNNGSSLMNLYPSTISRIERAQHRQHVSNAGNLVLKIYRRLRQQPNRSYVNNMFIVPRRQSNTKNVSKMVEQPSTYAVTPSQAFYPTAKASMDQSLRSERLSLAAWSPQTDIYSSPVRQSPVKARLMTSFSRSPGAFSQSPKAHAVESFSREPIRPRSMSTCDSFSPQRPTVPERMLHPQDSCHSLQTQLHSPQTAGAPAGHHGLPFDSSLSSRRDFCPSKKIDEDFVKLYHKCVCQNKSFFHGQPCRTCARSPEASRGHSSSSLATLALSPHRSLLRKRHREQGWDSHHQSKRFRDENYASSPGSRRHGNEMLRRCLSTSEYDGISYSQQQHVAQIQRPAALSRSTSGDLDESGV